MSRGEPRRDGRVAVVTAGVPGAGKSHTVSTNISDIEGYRRLDADDIKDDLLKQSVSDGIYDDLMRRPLADDRPIAPRELATLVHSESVAIVDELRRVTDAGEDPLGGRFTPPAIIAAAYPDASSESVCLANARLLYAVSQESGIANVRLDIIKDGEHEASFHKPATSARK